MTDPEDTTPDRAIASRIVLAWERGQIPHHQPRVRAMLLPLATATCARAISRSHKCYAAEAADSITAGLVRVWETTVESCEEGD